MSGATTGRTRGSPAVPGEVVAEVDEEKLILLYSVHGLTHKQLAQRFRISLTRVGRILARHGIAHRKGRRSFP